MADCHRPFVDFTSSSRLLSASGGLWELDELRLLAVAKLQDRDDGCLEAGEQAPRNSTEEGGRPVLKPVARAAHPKSRTQKQYCFSVRIALGVCISVLCASENVVAAQDRLRFLTLGRTLTNRTTNLKIGLLCEGRMAKARCF